MRGWSCLGAILLTTSAAAQGNVWTVDTAGGGDFSDLNTAVATAGDGDVLLVKYGIGATANWLFQPIDGKSLTFVADEPLVYLRPNITISNLAANQHVTFRGFDLWYGTQLDLENNAGTVWLDGCQVRADLYGGSGSFGAIHAKSSQVVLQDCDVTGSIQYGFYAAPPTSALVLENSTAVVHGGSLRGGDGTDTIYPDLPGATGVVLDDSTLYATGTSIQGGSANFEAGGTGLVASAGSTVYLCSTPVTGGSGVPFGQPTSVDGSSSVITLPGQPHTIASNTVLREGETLDLTVSGSPGDLVWLLFSIAPGFAPSPFGPSVLLVDPTPPAWGSFLGPVPGGGSLGVSYPVPDLGSVPSVDFFVQDAYFDVALGELRFGPAATTILVDGIY